MFGRWRKKPDDFEWHKYVRTTIKLRREQRRENVVQAKASAARGIRAALLRSWHLAKDGSIASALALVSFSKFLGSQSWRGLKFAGSGIAAGTAYVGQATGRGLGIVGTPIVQILQRPSVRAPLGWIGVLAALAGGVQWAGHGVDMQVKAAAGISATAMLLAYGPWLAGQLSRWTVAEDFQPAPWLARLGAAIPRPKFSKIASKAPPGGQPAAPSSAARSNAAPTNAARSNAAHEHEGANHSSGKSLPFGSFQGIAATALAVTLLVLGYFGLPYIPAIGGSISQLASQLPMVKPPPPPIEGRARALTGDVIRIGTKEIRIAGIEAPEIAQICKNRRRRSWRCGRTARWALGVIVKRGTLRCQPDSEAAADGRLTATCYKGDKDIALRLLGRGRVFARDDAPTSYSEQQDIARKAKRGIWQGEALRPAAYRARLWEAAKRRAPDGCPIKGDVTRAGKFYVLPWAPNYRRVKIRKSRGERWFCSESAARAAGWKNRG